MDLAIFASLVGEVILLSRVDHKLYGTWCTPFSLLAYPYVIIVLLAYCVGPAFDFVPLHASSLVVWMVGLFVVWAAGIVLGWEICGLEFRGGGQASAAVPPPDSTEPYSTRWAIVGAWVMAPVVIYRFFTTLRDSGGWTQIYGMDFRIDYSRGLHGHLVVLGLALTILLIGTYRKGNWLQLATILLLLSFTLASQVKGTLFQSIAGGLIFRVLRGNLRLSAKRVTVVVICSFLAFNLVYMFGWSLADANTAVQWDVYNILARHYFFYLFSGPLALSEALHNNIKDVGGAWQSVFSPFINLYRAVIGMVADVPAGSLLEKGMDVDLERDEADGGTNVYTFFGTLYLHLGAVGGILYVLVAALLCYGLLMLAQRTANEWVLVVYGFIAAQLFFGFFELFFWHLTTLEVTGYGLLLAGVTKWYRSRMMRRAATLNPAFEPPPTGI